MVHSSSSAHVIYHRSAILWWPWPQPVLIQTQEMENWFLTRQITVKRFCVLFNQPGLMESQPFSFLITYILNKFSIFPCSWIFRFLREWFLLQILHAEILHVLPDFLYVEILCCISYKHGYSFHELLWNVSEDCSFVKKFHCKCHMHVWSFYVLISYVSAKYHCWKMFYCMYHIDGLFFHELIWHVY